MYTNFYRKKKKKKKLQFEKHIVVRRRDHRLLTSRYGIGNASRAHVDRHTINVVLTSFCRQRFRKDLNISVKGNSYALLKGFLTTYVFLLRALESVLVLGNTPRFQSRYVRLIIYGETKGSTLFRNRRAQGCGDPSGARALLRARGFLNSVDPVGRGV